MVAVIQFVLTSFLSAEWGVICVILGILNLAFPYRAMLAANGFAMILVGIGNAGVTLLQGQSVGLWTGLGAMQIVWGVNELRRFATGRVRL